MAKILVEIVGDAKKFKSELGNAGRDAEQFGGKVKSHASGALKGLGIAAGGAALLGVAALGKGLMDGVKTAIAHENALAQTNAVIKSTGGAANVNSAHILKLSDSIEKMSGMDDLAVQSGENMLLTFKNIKNGAGDANKIFDQSTKILADMTVALGSDPQKQAIQLGKALNDPVKGISALARVGVTFTEQQKKNIAAMVEHGNVAGAQKVILKELQSEFGGSAKAAGETMGGQLNILKAHLEDTEQVIGEKVLPVLNQLIAWAITNWPTFQHYAEIAMAAIATAWDSVLKPAIDAISAAIEALVGFVQTHWDNISGIFTAQFAIITGTIDAFIALFTGDWEGLWKAVKQIVKGAFDLIQNTIELAGPLLLAAAKAVGEKILSGIKEGVEGLLDAALSGVKAIPGALRNLLEDLGSAASEVGGKVFDGIKGGVSGIAEKVAGFVNDIPGKLRGLLDDVGNAAGEIGSRILSKITGALSGLAGDLAGIVKGAVNSLIGAANAGFNVIHDHWPDIPGAPGPPFGHNPIPQLAAGGIATRATLAMIGEAGPEAVIPLSRAGGGFGGTTVNVTVEGSVVTEQELAEKIRNVLIRTGRTTTGGALGGFA